VSVQPSQAYSRPPKEETEEDQMFDFSASKHAGAVTDKLVEFLHSRNWQAERRYPLDAHGFIIHDPQTLPVGSIRIQVGLYPPMVYMPPPGDIEMNAVQNKWKQQEERQELERRQRMEQRWSKLPRAEQEKREKAYDELTAKIKQATRSGPCQPLNPSF